MAKEIYNKNAREKALLEEAYAQVLKEGFTGSSEAGFTAPPEDILDDAPPKVTLDPIGEISGAKAYYVLINDKSVALVTRFGPRDTFTVYADPLGDGLPVEHNPKEPREDLDHKQVIGHEALIALFQSEDEDQEWPAEWSTDAALTDILADLQDAWQEGKYGDADKESLKDYINEFIDTAIDTAIDDGQIDDAPLPDHPAGGGRPRQGASGPLGWGAERKEKFPLFY